MKGISIIQGTNRPLLMRWVTGAQKTPVDLTTYVITSQMRKENSDDVAPFYTFSPVADPDQTANRGVLRIPLVAADTFAWPPGKYLCDLYFSLPGGEADHSETFSITVRRAQTL